MIKIREALRSDNKGLLELTALTPMRGQISLRIDRYPDFFSLLDYRGPNKVFVAESPDKIIASISAASVQVCVNGIPRRVHYIGDLKVHPAFQRTNLAFRMANHMLNFLYAADADLLFCTAAHGNEAVMPFFEGKLGLPKFRRLGYFRVFQIIPAASTPENGLYKIQEEQVSFDLLRLYKAFFKRYQFGPIFSEEALQDARHLVARFKDTIVAAISLVDISDAKQNVLIGLPYYLKIPVSCLRAIHGVFPLISIPRMNEPIRILYIRAFFVDRNFKEAFHYLLQKARNIAFRENYTFLTVGIHERDPLAKGFAFYPKFNFRSHGLAASLKNDEEEMHELLKGIPFEDYSLV